MRLYLIRHAKARQGTDDIQRPLSKRGLNDSKQIAEFLRRCKIRAKTIWHSERVRSLQTAEIVSAAIPGSTLVQQNDISPESPISPTRKLIDQLTEDLIIVGHQPMLGRLAAKILTDQKNLDMLRFRTSDVACLLKADDGRWQLEWLVGSSLVEQMMGE